MPVWRPYFSSMLISDPSEFVKKDLGLDIFKNRYAQRAKYRLKQAYKDILKHQLDKRYTAIFNKLVT